MGGYPGPGGGLLGDHEHVRVGLKDVGIELLEEIHRLQILVPAEEVGASLPVLPAIVQIEHGGHRVHPQAVDVELLQPEQGRGVEKGADFAACVIEDTGAPVGMLSLAGSAYS